MICNILYKNFGSIQIDFMPTYIRFDFLRVNHNWIQIIFCVKNYNPNLFFNIISDHINN